MGTAARASGGARLLATAVAALLCAADDERSGRWSGERLRPLRRRPLEAVDGILAQADGGSASATEAIEELLKAQIALRNNRRLDAAMRSSRLPAVKTLAEFDFAFQPSIKREQIESLHC